MENLEQLPADHYFGVNILRSTPEIADLPPEESAAQSLATARRHGDGELILAIEDAERQISSIVHIEEVRQGVVLGLTDLFTANQLKEMNRRMTLYLGKSAESHLIKPSRPKGFDLYVKRLGFHFASTNDDVTRSFGAFELHHENPSESAIGPHEVNSRTYALFAIEQMEYQFKNYYQSGITFSPTGPSKLVDNVRVPERGVAECQFLVMDYVRDLLAHENATKARTNGGEVMTLGDIEANIMTLLTQRTALCTEVSRLNPLMGSQIDELIGELNSLTVPVMHRGRPGIPKFRREPNTARSLINRIEAVLIHAESMSVPAQDEEEIPIIEL